MNVTNADYKSFAAKVDAELLRVPEAVKIEEQKIDARIEFETKAVLEGSNICPVYVEDQFRLNIAGIKDAKVKEQISKQFYNPNVMKAAACAIDAMYYGLSGKQGDISISQMVRNRITNMKLLASGIQGTATSISLGGADDVAVTKFPNEGSGSGDEDIMHELFVATVAGVNSLRSFIPNFAYVFGGFRCTAPLVNKETREVTGWCSDAGDEKVRFLLMENINPAITAASYIGKANANQTLSLYFQAILALELANRTLDFTHYDAHTENLLMRDVSAAGVGRVFLIPYTRSTAETVYIKSDRVATFIDYGMAGVRYKGVYYGAHALWRSKLAIFTDRPWPLHDAYKLLMFLIMDASEARNEKALSVLVKIFRFFNKRDDPLKAARFTENRADPISQWPQRFALPYIEKTTSYTMDDLIDYMMTNLDHKDILFTARPARVSVLRCTNCATFSGVLKMISSGTELRPKNFFEFYDAATGLGEDDPLYKTMRRNFAYRTASKEWLTHIETLQRDARELAARAYRVDLKSFSVARPLTVKLMQRSYYDIYKLLSLTEDIELQIKIGDWMANRFEDSKLKTYILRSEVGVHRRILCELIGHAVDSYALIEEFINSPEWTVRLRANPSLKWYKTAGNILDLQTHICVSETPPTLRVREPSVSALPLGVTRSAGGASSSSSSSFFDYYTR